MKYKIMKWEENFERNDISKVDSNFFLLQDDNK